MKTGKAMAAGSGPTVRRSCLGIAGWIAFLFLSALECLASDDYPPFKLGLSTQFVAAGFDLVPKPPGNTGEKLTYRPAESDYIGLVLGYRWLAGTVSFSIPANADIRDREGVSQYRDYRLSYFFKKWGGELAYSRYRGYLIDNSSVLSAATLAGQTYYKVDLETIGFGASAFYVLSESAYSLASAMDQSELQKGSDGAWVLMATYRHQYIQNPQAWIPAEKMPAYGLDQGIHYANTQSAAAGGGYGYNWIPGNYFLSALLAITLGYQQVEYENGISDHLHSVQGNAHFRLGTGYNSRDYFLTANFYADRYQQETQSIEIGNTIYGVTLAGGVRF